MLSKANSLPPMPLCLKTTKRWNALLWCRISYLMRVTGRCGGRSCQHGVRWGGLGGATGTRAVPPADRIDNRGGQDSPWRGGQPCRRDTATPPDPAGRTASPRRPPRGGAVHGRPGPAREGPMAVRGGGGGWGRMVGRRKDGRTSGVLAGRCVKWSDAWAVLYIRRTVVWKAP